MVEKSIIFDFIRSPTFFDDFNQSGKFNVNQMDGSTKNFEFVLMSDCEDNYEDQVNQNGILQENVGTKINVGTSGQVALNYIDIGNNARSISVGSSDVDIELGETDTYIKGLFLVQKTTRYVLAYTIFETPSPLTNILKIPKDGVIWTIRNEV